jgi:hypothetical protein
MSRKFCKESGNDTIDPYPLPYRGKLTKLLCISKERFEKLKAAWDEFGIKPKPASPGTTTPFQKKLPKKVSLRGSRNEDLKPSKYKCISSFEPSNIFNTRDSSFWRLQNLKTWFKEQESYEDSRYIKPYSIEI